MAQEIKSIDVENNAEEYYIKLFQKFGWTLKSSQRIFNQDSRSVGAISYESVTYVHSETDTVDFTKLVFERNTKMPNYDQLVTLEEEFWELGEIVSKGKPYMPPHAEHMEDWAKHFEPDLRPKEEKMRMHIIFGILMAVMDISFMTLANTFEDMGFIFSWAAVLNTVIFGFIWFKTNKGAKRHALKVALKPNKSRYRTTLEELYRGVTAKIDLYNQSADRMAEIVNLADQLLDI